jgi:hypothetical protein
VEILQARKNFHNTHPSESTVERGVRSDNDFKIGNIKILQKLKVDIK